MPSSTSLETQLPSALMREQIVQGLGIPRSLYLDPDLYRHEVAAMFNRSWMYVAHQSQLANVGQYAAVDCGSESVIVARTEDGLAAFNNVCRHRGSRLVDAGCGVAKRFVCPYHQWAYRLDGTLSSAPLMPETFDPAAYPLRPAQLTIWNGLVLVCLAPEPAPPIDELLGGAQELIGPFDIANARVATTISYQVRANWKLVWENAQECYHCGVNHPELMKTFSLAPLRNPEWMQARMHRSADCRVQYSPLELRGAATSLTIDGTPASTLMGQFADGLEPYTAAVHLKPMFAMVCSPDYAVVLADRPLAVDRTEVTMTWLVRADAVEGRDYDLDNLIKVWDATNQQDWALCERTQRGVESVAFEPGPLSGDEPSVGAFHEAYAQMLHAAGF